MIILKSKDTRGKNHICRVREVVTYCKEYDERNDKAIEDISMVCFLCVLFLVSSDVC